MSKINQNKFLVTGGAGLIGSHVVDQLLVAGAQEVHVVDILERGSIKNIEGALKHKSVSLHQVNICDVDAITRLMTGMDGCFHLAALRITECAEKPRKALEVMVNGSFNVFRACIEADVKKVVFSSTASVYGMADLFPTGEHHHPWHNNTLYGATKVACEGFLRAFHDTDKLNYVALRYFNVYGPRMDVYGKYTEVLIRWMDCFEKGNRPKIFGDGKQTMDFVCVPDIARANLLAMDSNHTDTVYNIARGEEVSLLDLLYGLARVYGVSDPNPEFLPARAVNPVPRRLADVSKAERELGFKATIGLDEGLKMLVEWYKSQPMQEA